MLCWRNSEAASDTIKVSTTLFMSFRDCSLLAEEQIYYHISSFWGKNLSLLATTRHPLEACPFTLYRILFFLLLGFYFFYYFRIAETFVFETTSYLGYLFRKICVNNVICFLGKSTRRICFDEIHLNLKFRWNFRKVSTKFIWVDKCDFMFAWQ